MYYQLKIDYPGATPIQIPSGFARDSSNIFIKKVDMAVAQQNQFASNRSDQLFADLVVEGVINDDSQGWTRELFDWSLKLDNRYTYATVEISVYNGNELVRFYKIPDMFCVSYQEMFDDTAGNVSHGRFKLVLKQKMGSISKLEVRDQ